MSSVRTGQAMRNASESVVRLSKGYDRFSRRRWCRDGGLPQIHGTRLLKRIGEPAPYDRQQREERRYDPWEPR
ncbi:MAG: hypothetical protein ACR2NF_12535 [Pirellulales bacterium]